MINYKGKIRARTDYRDKLLILKLLTVFPVRSESKNVPTFPILHEEIISMPAQGYPPSVQRDAPKEGK